MASRLNAERHAEALRGSLPPPGDDPMSRAVHTLAVFEGQVADDELLVLATSGVYEQPTGLTWGDLRELVRRLEAVEQHLEPDWSQVR